MRKIYLIGSTTALLGLFTIATDTAPALAGGAAGYSVTNGVYLKLPSQLSPGPQAQAPVFGGQEYAKAPCGGDFGMLGNIETKQEVAQANPMNAPVCD